MSPTKKHVNKCPNYKKLYGDNQKTLMEVREEVVSLMTELKMSWNARDNMSAELTAIKSDYRKLATLDCRQCTNQEKLVKENKTMFRYLIAMAVITISALGWAYITWSMR